MEPRRVGDGSERHSVSTTRQSRGYLWLADTQLPEGCWFNYYLAGHGVKDPRLDTNVCAYVATGAWHHYV